MKQQFKETRIPLVVITLETKEDQAKFDELKDDLEYILLWLDELHDQGKLDDDYNVNHLTWQGASYEDKAEFNLFYDDTGELVKLIVQKSKTNKGEKQS